MRFTQRDIRDVWKDIEKPLRDTIHPAESPEELYHLCRIGQAHVFTCPEGFIVLQEFMSGTKKVVHIWIAYGTGGNLIQTHLPDIEELARSVGAKELSFNTQRKGFERALPEGWKMNFIDYRKAL